MPTGFSIGGGSFTFGFDSALLLAGEIVRAQWAAVAQRYADTGRYAKSIRITGVDSDGSGAFVLTLEGHAPYAIAIEDGRIAFNLADKVRWGQTAGERRNKKGEPYIIVPMKHYAFVSPAKREQHGLSRSAERGMMPEDVYELAKAMERSHFTGGPRTYVHYANPAPGRTPVSQDGQTSHLEERNYKWGGRLSGVPAPYAKRFRGMYRFSGGGHTTYTTFRTLKPGSQWNIPAFAGHKMAEKALELSLERAADVLAKQVVSNIEAVILGSSSS